MRVQVSQIRGKPPTSGDTPTHVALLFDFGRATVSYTVRVSLEPFIAVEAPHSLWDALRSIASAPKKLASLIAEWLSGEEIGYPVLFGEIDENTFKESRARKLWPADQTRGDRLSLTELEWAADHLVLERSNSLFPCPFEHRVIKMGREELLPVAAEVDLLSHRITETRTVLAPKSTVGTRLASQLNPLDALLLTAIVAECGLTVERSRIPIGEGIVHSFRFDPTDWGALWSTSTNYSTFEKMTDLHTSSGSVQFVVEADVAAFYHRISPGFVGHQLERMGVHSRRAESVTRLLCSISDVGLPVGPSVSAFFAEVVMSAVDEMLLSNNVNYVRFNDDLGYFVNRRVRPARNSVCSL